jgi:hypothetical protein
MLTWEALRKGSTRLVVLSMARVWPGAIAVAKVGAASGKSRGIATTSAGWRAKATRGRR